jgi:hypothetical protein
VKGTVKGTPLGAEGIIASQSDTCDGIFVNGIEQNLLENYCIDDTHYSGTIFNCPNGCKDGACLGSGVSEPTPRGHCDDSDGGLNYDVVGTLKIEGSGVYSDCCKDGPNAACTTGGSYVSELACKKTNPDFGTPVEENLIRQDYKCPYGCLRGACLSQPAECAPYKELPLFGRNSTYNFDGKDYLVSIKESKIMNQFDVSINGEMYSSKSLEGGFETGKGEKVYLGKAYAASTVMYTSIEFCMTKGTVTERAQDNAQQSEGFFARILNWFKRLF